MRHCILALAFALAAHAQAPPAQTGFTNTFILGSGLGFKPYQTSLKAGSSSFVEGGYHVSTNVYAFTRIDLRSTDAQMLLEGCRSIFSSQTNLLLLCGGPGIGANADNVGISIVGGGKWFFSPEALRKQLVWVGIEVSVDKTTVPAPVTNDTTTSPVQPSFRIGIYKVF